jgi:hypothetical protein
MIYIVLTISELMRKYRLLIERNGEWVDKKGCVHPINNSRVNGDLMDEMEAGLLCDSLHYDSNLTLEELTKKYGTLTLTEHDYYVDSKGIIRHILPYRPFIR